MTEPLFVNGKEARRILGLGIHKFRRLVAAGVIPYWQDPDTGFKHFSREALADWARTLGRAS